MNDDIKKNIVFFIIMVFGLSLIIITMYDCDENNLVEKIIFTYNESVISPKNLSQYNNEIPLKILLNGRFVDVCGEYKACSIPPSKKCLEEKKPFVEISVKDYVSNQVVYYKKFKRSNNFFEDVLDLEDGFYELELIIDPEVCEEYDYYYDFCSIKQEEHRIKVYFYVNKKLKKEENGKFIEDNEVPKLIVKFPKNNSLYSDRVPFVFESKDNFPFVKERAELYILDPFSNKFKFYNTFKTGSLVELPEGNYMLRIIVKDIANNSVERKLFFARKNEVFLR